MVVVDDEQHALVELDFSQEEIFIAAVVFGDDALLADCNAGDVYCQMVRGFSAGDLAPGDEAIDDEKLAGKYSDLRDRWKVITLAIVYGMTDESVTVAAKLPSVEAAKRWWDGEDA
jgi:DNA polymerase I-like protein with 3'-5' exonuclease and polymerase domains